MKNLFSALSLICLTTFGQSPYPIPNIDFISYPPVGNSREVADNIPSALDIVNNGVYIAGHTKTGAGSQDFILLKYDTVGNFKWKKTYDKAGLDDRIFDIAVDNSGNVYVTGGSQDITSGFDVATIKYDLNGNQIWVARYNGGGNSDDKGFSIAFDGSNVFVCGFSSSATTGKDFTVIKYNSSGVQQYVYTKNGTANGDDVANSLVWQSNKLYVTGNLKNTTSNQDIYTTRLNAINGNFDWSQTINGTANLDDQSLDIKLNGGDVLICGGITNTGTNQDYHFARLNSNNGATVFSKSYDAFGGDDYATSLIFNLSSTYAIVGLAQNGTNYDYHTVKYNNAGIFSWVHKLQRGTGFSAVLPKIEVDILGDFYVCGASQNNSSLDGVLYQLAPSGNQAWIDYQDGFGLRDAHVDLSTDNLGHVYLASLNERLTNVFDIALIRYSQTPVYAPIDFSSEPNNPAYLFYKNDGQVFDSAYNNVTQVKYCTELTNPKLFFGNNNISFLFASIDTLKTTVDTVHRIQLDFNNSNKLTKNIFD